MKKWIEKFSRRYGFTQTEITIILFLLFTFLIGLIANYIKESGNNSSYLEFDYSVQDSMFNAAAGQIEMEDTIKSKDMQITVASKNEVLDFASHKKREPIKLKLDIPQNGLNINTATVQQLAALPGVGAKTAENIVKFRNQFGKIRKAEQLLNVKGIGKAKLEKLKKFLLFE